MKTLSKISLLAVATAALAFSSANAQTLTLETVSDYEGNVRAFNNGQSLTQTFSNVLGVQEMTYRFVMNSSFTTYETTFNAYFVEWTPQNKAGALLWSATGLTVLPSSNPAWVTYYDLSGNDYPGFDYTLAPGLNSLNPNQTYAMILLATGNSNSNVNGASTRIGLEMIYDTNPNGDSFTYGSALSLASVSTFDTLQSTASSSISGISDFGFQQIIITPVPEPQTAAAILVVLFVAGLVARRVYLKRQEAAAALVPVSAS